MFPGNKTLGCNAVTRLLTNIGNQHSRSTFVHLARSYLRPGAKWNPLLQDLFSSTGWISLLNYYFLTFFKVFPTQRHDRAQRDNRTNWGKLPLYGKLMACFYFFFIRGLVVLTNGSLWTSGINRVSFFFFCNLFSFWFTVILKPSNPVKRSLGFFLDGVGEK